MRRGSATSVKITWRWINMGCNTWVHESNVRNISVQLSLSQLAKTLCLPYYAYVFSSTKFLGPSSPVTEGGKGEEGGEGVLKKWGKKKRNDGVSSPTWISRGLPMSTHSCGTLRVTWTNLNCSKWQGTGGPIIFIHTANIQSTTEHPMQASS
jgi:hypothetical protein